MLSSISPMAADVTTLLRIMEAYKEELEVKRRGLFTRHLFDDGGDRASSAGVRFSMELDLDLQVPSGWERRLDLTSGKTYLHRLDSNLPSDELCDLNLPPPAGSAAVFLPEDSKLLDLKLSGGGSSWAYQSVCTLEKVESALKRVVRKEQHRRAEEGSSSASGSPSTSTASSSRKRRGVAGNDGGSSDATGGMMAAACPSCLLYVLISKAKPRCPRCGSHVPVPCIAKKPKFDLNSY